MSHHMRLLLATTITASFCLFQTAPINAQDGHPRPVQAEHAVDVYHDPIVDLLEEVDQSILYNTVYDLQVNSPYGTRYTLNLGAINNAADYIEDRLHGFGLPAWQEVYYYDLAYRPNVIAQITGSTYPDKVYVLCAHFDSTAVDGLPMFNAPGAEDNASGTAAVLECARILAASDYNCKSTVRFILFSGEEQGAWGSWNYVEDHVAEDIQGVINCDMVGYWGNGEVQIGYHSDYSKWLADLARLTAYVYVPNVTRRVFKIPSGEILSDQYCFDKEGFSAIMITEDEDKDYPWYHSIDDTIDKLDFEMLEACTKIALATAAKEAGGLYAHDWISPDDYEGPGYDWYDEPLAYDKDLETKADTPVTWTTWQWTPFLVLTLDTFRLCDAVRFVAWKDADRCKEIDIDYYGYEWRDLYQGGEYDSSTGDDWTWTAKAIPDGPHYVKKVRVRFLTKRKYLDPAIEADLNELELREVKQ